jgi:hypothetical protein
MCIDESGEQAALSSTCLQKQNMTAQQQVQQQHQHSTMI